MSHITQVRVKIPPQVVYVSLIHPIKGRIKIRFLGVKRRGGLETKAPEASVHEISGIFHPGDGTNLFFYQNLTVLR